MEINNTLFRYVKAKLDKKDENLLDNFDVFGNHYIIKRIDNTYIELSIISGIGGAKSIQLPIQEFQSLKFDQFVLLINQIFYYANN